MTALRLGDTELAKQQLELYQKQLQSNQRYALAASKTAQGDKEPPPEIQRLWQTIARQSRLIPRMHRSQ
jgi:hypothetical protein